MAARSVVRRVTAPRALLVAAAILLPGVALHALPYGYVSLADVANRMQLRLTRDPQTGVVVCEGRGLRVTTGPGMSVVLLNGEGLPLGDPVVEEDGDLRVPASVARAIEAKAGLSAVAPVSRMPGRAVPAPLPPAARNETIPVSFAQPAAAVSPRSARSGPVRPPSPPFTVVVDAGHGGMHTGGKGDSGLMEKNVNLDVARRLQARLEAAGARVIMTRTGDTAFSSDINEDLRHRFTVSNRAVPDLFLSIHSNWSENGSARGFEVFVRTESPADQARKLAEDVAYPVPPGRLGGAPPADAAVDRMLNDLLIGRSSEGGRLLAREIERRFAKSLSTENRGLKERPFQVIRWSNAPAVLVELEFISNGRGERELGSAAHREKLAGLLADAVAAFRAQWGR